MMGNIHQVHKLIEEGIQPDHLDMAYNEIGDLRQSLKSQSLSNCGIKS
jgi:hypothetical protein